VEASSVDGAELPRLCGAWSMMAVFFKGDFMRFSPEPVIQKLIANAR
jgi:hypothetical protein